MSMENILKVGMVQLLIEGGEPDRNLSRAEEYIKKSSDTGCAICLLPECLDLAWTHPSSKTKSLPIPGGYSDKLCNAAQEFNIYVCAGLTEKDGDRVYNSCILIDSRGEIILKYRKINVLAIAQEFYSIGNSISIVDTPFGMVGMNICSDNYEDSLEIGNVLARMGAQIILSPCSWTSDYHIHEKVDPYGEKWVRPYINLANSFDLIIIGTTSVGYIVGGPYEGKKMVGQSLAVGKNGIITEGIFNEFASDLVIVEFEIPKVRQLGTHIGEMLRQNTNANKDN